MDKKDWKAILSQDREVIGFMNRNGLSLSYFDRQIAPFIDFHDSNLLCKECKGLSSCLQKKKGERMNLAYDGSVYNEMEYCPFYLEYEKKKKEASSFVYNDIPAQFKELTLDDVDMNEKAVSQLLLYLYQILDGKRKKGLYIYGDLGVGKTYACMALANSLAKKGITVAFVKVNAFVNDCRKLVAKDSGEYETLLRKLKEVSVLILDDIGSESVSAYSRDDLLFNILDHRMEHSFTTLFTSNLSKEGLKKHYSFDKSETIASIRAERLLERIDILSENYCLVGANKRRKQ